MKDEIRTVAVELLIRHGYQGFHFRAIADQIGTTRANVHYYFGNKQQLVDDVVCAYVANTLDRFEAIWNDRDRSLSAKIRAMMEFNRERYLKHNPTGRTGNPWSLIARIRLDRELVGADASRSTLDFSSAIDKLVRRGIRAAIARGELVTDTPVKDVALQIVAIANSADPITQDAGSFERLEQLYNGFARILLHAYGGPTHGRAPIRPHRHDSNDRH